MFLLELIINRELGTLVCLGLNSFSQFSEVPSTEKTSILYYKNMLEKKANDWITENS